MKKKIVLIITLVILIVDIKNVIRIKMSLKEKTFIVLIDFHFML